MSKPNEHDNVFIGDMKVKIIDGTHNSFHTNIYAYLISSSDLYDIYTSK